MAKALSGILIASIALFAAAHAAAQARDNFFARDRNVAVMERARPGYQALGLPLGGFIAYPKLELGIENNSNIYATPNGAKGDSIGLINPELDIMSRWSRNSLSAFVKGASRQYATRTNESATDWQLGGAGEVFVGDTTVDAGGAYGYFATPRSASISGTTLNLITIHPVEYYRSDANFGLTHTFNRLRISGGVVYSNYDYQNGRNALGGTVLEKPFTQSQTVASAKAEYAISPDTAVYVTGAYNTIHYPNQLVGTLNRNSTGETYAIGANFDISQLVRGDVQVGYLNQDFAASGFGSASGFSAKGKVQWFPTQLTTVTLIGARQINPATVAGSPAVLSGSVGGQVDHELLRNVILTALAHYQLDDYRGVDRHDRITELGLSGEYLLNRNIGVHLGYSYLKQDSSGLFRGLTFDVNRVMLSTTLQY